MKVEKIWAQYRRGLKAFLHARISNKAEVDDVLQEILIKTYENLGTLRDMSNVKAWLYKVAGNAITDYYRRNARSQGINNENLWYSPEAPGIREELSLCVEPFIRNLPEEAARLLTAIDIEGRSQKDYANEQGISYSTLKSRVQKARTLLREQFDRCCRFTLDASGNLAEYEQKPTSCQQC